MEENHSHTLFLLFKQLKNPAVPKPYFILGLKP